jgi:uncharacterized membrane protein (TIGR02234 family)
VRSGLRLAVLLTLVGSALVLLAARRTWIEVPSSDGLTIASLHTTVRGSRVSGVPQALGLVGLAGVLALVATRGVARAVVGALVGLAGLGVVVDAVRSLHDGLLGRLVSGHASDVCDVGASTSGCLLATERFVGITEHPGWAWLTLVGGLVLLAAGALVVARGRSWAGLSSAYQVPAATAAEPPAGDKAVWDALDRGDDPTA